MAVQQPGICAKYLGCTFMIAGGTTHEQQRAASAAMVALLIKPVDPRELCRILRYHIAQRVKQVTPMSMLPALIRRALSGRQSMVSTCRLPVTCWIMMWNFFANY